MLSRGPEGRDDGPRQRGKESEREWEAEGDVASKRQGLEGFGKPGSEAKRPKGYRGNMGPGEEML